MKPRLIVEQKITALVNQYRIYSVTDGGEKGDMVAFAQQKRFAFKEKVLFYRDEQKTEEVFGFRAEKTLDVHGRYFVEDADGNLLGIFRKHFKKSLLNSTWEILDKDSQPVITVSESSKVYAVVRRVMAFIPYIGELAEIVGALIKYHFVFRDAATGEEVGKYRKTTMFRDHYELAMTDEAYAKQDWHVLAAMGVALDALQDR